MELFEYKGVPVVIDGAHVPESVKAAVSEAHLRNHAIGPQVLLVRTHSIGGTASHRLEKNLAPVQEG